MNPLHSTIPLFDQSITVNAAHARQDRIKLRWGDWYKQDTIAELGEYILGLAGSQVADIDGHELILTGSPTGSRRDTFEIRSGRTGANNNQPIALMSGHLHAFRVWEREGVGRVRVFADLSLNPSRYAAYQDRPSRQRHSPELRLAPPVMRRPSPSRRSGTSHEGFQAEQMLVPDHDNAIVSDSFFLRNYDERVWPNHVRNYMTGVQNLLNQAIVGGDDVAYAPEVNLHEVETYFEFTHASPVAVIAALQEAIVARRAQVGVTVYPSGTVENSVDQNARCITVRRSNAVVLKIYAKTTKRIRLEVLHKLTESALVVGGRHRTTDLEVFYRWLDLLASDAARLANELLGDLRPALPVTSEPMRAIELFRSIAAACERSHDMLAVLELLCINGRLAIGRHDPLVTVKDRLLRDGVLMNRPRNTRDTVYTLSPHCAHAASVLRSSLFPSTVAVNQQVWSSTLD